MHIIKYLTVVISSMFKFIFGPLSGFSLGLSFWESYLLTVLGMMLSVFIFTFLGKIIKEKVFPFFSSKKKKLFTSYNRRKVRIWRKYGMAGVAFLTPLILTPIGGTLLASSFGEHKTKIFTYMLISAVIWGGILVSLIYFLNEATQKILGH